MKKVSQENKDVVANMLLSMMGLLNERDRRLLAGAVAHSMSYGGITYVHQITGMCMQTISQGVREITELRFSSTEEILTPEGLEAAMINNSGHIRKPGGRRHSIVEKYPGVKDFILEIIGDDTYGNPQSSLKYKNMSLRILTATLKEAGYDMSHVTAGKILGELGYSKQQNQKLMLDGPEHEDRNAQFEFIKEKTAQAIESGDIVISVDTKKKSFLATTKGPALNTVP